MSEIESKLGSNAHEDFDQVSELVITQYPGLVANVARRWEVYKYATDPIDIHDLAIENLGLQGDETILDVGCADGQALMNLRFHDMHRGQLIGLDMHEDFFLLPTHVIEKEVIEHIDFVVGDGQDLPFKDDSMDVVMAFFMLYHVPEPSKALSEFRRVLKPDGRLVVATSGNNNKSVHRKLERLIAKYLGVEPPPIFSTHFNSEIANEALPEMFGEDNVRAFKQLGDIHISTIEGYEKYIDSLASMKDCFDPIPTCQQWEDAIESVVEPYMLREAGQKGYFSDTIERDLYICQNS